MAMTVRLIQRDAVARVTRHRSREREVIVENVPDDASLDALLGFLGRGRRRAIPATRLPVIAARKVAG